MTHTADSHCPTELSSGDHQTDLYEYFDSNVVVKDNNFSGFTTEPLTVWKEIPIYDCKAEGCVGGLCENKCGSGGYCCSGANHKDGNGPIENGDCPKEGIDAVTSTHHSCVKEKNILGKLLD